MDDTQKYGLTDYESEIWQLRQQGLTYRAIASRLQLAEEAVKAHVKTIVAKFNSLPSDEPTSNNRGILDIGFWINLPEQ